MVAIGIDEIKITDQPKKEYWPQKPSRLAEFLPLHLVVPSGSIAAGTASAQDRITLTGTSATAKRIGEVFDRLRDQARKSLVAGDMVAIFLNTHVLDWGKGQGKSTIVAPADLSGAPPAGGPVISTQDISNRLGELANAGVRVVLFLDGVHLPRSGEGTLRSEINPWIRDLLRERRIITFIASRYGPSQISDSQRQGIFALGLLQAFRRSQAGAKQGEPMSILAFEKSVVEEVRNLGDRSQEPRLYRPASVLPSTPFAQP
jgi:hypothetical protein